MTGDGLLGRTELERAFMALGDRLFRRGVAAELGLPPWWLNEQASVYVSTQPDGGRREVFDHPGLRVMAASPEHVFAMKAFAARSRDEDDLRRLADIIGVRSVADAVDVCARFFPSEPLPERSKGVLEDLFSE